VRVRALYTYPVKACRGLELEAAALDPLGLEHDRRFAFMAEDGLALTQRDQPLLATVRPVLQADALRLDFGGLFEAVFSFTDFAERTRVDVWSDAVPACAAREARAVNDYLGARVRLAMLDPQAGRSFADSRPVLVTTTGMLARLGVPGLGMERFRPNVVLEGDGDWRLLSGAEAALEYAKPCGRCEVTTIDQASGERRGPEPLRTLTERFAGEFGTYCRVARPGRLRRGETLRAS
jgi:hypothetical protein